MPIFTRHVLTCQTLYHHAHGLFVVCSQNQITVQLFGLGQIIGQHLRNARALQTHNALPHFTLARLQRQHKLTLLTHQVLQTGIVGNLDAVVKTCRTATGLFTGGFGHQQFQHARALHLQNKRAIKFQIGCQQSPCSHQFTQSAGNGGRIVFLAHNVLPHLL